MSEESNEEEKERSLKGESPFMQRRSNRRLGDQTGNSSSTWLISFTDVMALMLTFFVLLFAMSNPRHDEWEKFTHNVQENFNRFYGRPLKRGQEDAVNIAKTNFSKALDLNYLKALILNLIEQEPSLKIVRVIDNGDSLIVSLPQDLLFEVGQAEIKPQANNALFALAGTFGRIQNRIEIVGHTDPRPVTGEAFPSNWELSLARAANVAAVLENVGYNRSVAIRGQASGRYEDLPETMALEERLDLSRRVDIVVMEDDGKQMKLFDIGAP